MSDTWTSKKCKDCSNANQTWANASQISYESGWGVFLATRCCDEWFVYRSEYEHSANMPGKPPSIETGRSHPSSSEETRSELSWFAISYNYILTHSVTWADSLSPANNQVLCVQVPWSSCYYSGTGERQARYAYSTGALDSVVFLSTPHWTHCMITDNEET
jgi:hypothetical protein